MYYVLDLVQKTTYSHGNGSMWIVVQWGIDFGYVDL